MGRVRIPLPYGDGAWNSLRDSTGVRLVFINFAEELSGIRRDIELCGPILKVQNDSVHLVHQTTKEFLLRSRSSNSQIPRFVVAEITAHFEIATACITFLSFKEWERGALRGMTRHKCGEGI